jgi:hypothetical protein
MAPAAHSVEPLGRPGRFRNGNALGWLGLLGDWLLILSMNVFAPSARFLLQAQPLLYLVPIPKLRRAPGLRSKKRSTQRRTLDRPHVGRFLRNPELGVTTVGAIRRIGGDVVATPGFGHHVTVTGVGGEAVSPLLRIFTNPNPLRGPR